MRITLGELEALTGDTATAVLIDCWKRARAERRDEDAETAIELLGRVAQ